MSGRIPNTFIQDLIARTDIVEIIQPRVSLTKRGNNYLSCCPFHDEKSPSFSVNLQKQFYYCFGCSAHGNVINFLMAYDRMEFLEAVTYLAAHHGIEVPHEQDQVEQQSHKQLYPLMDAASQHYQNALRNSPEAITYLKSRGLTGVTAKYFGMGYALPKWDALLQHLGTSAETQNDLMTAGMLIRKDNGGFYDRFRHRIMFPIRDVRGQIIGFGGRSLNNDDKPKYLNSPETPIFHKSDELYGLYEARQSNRQLNHIIIVEGYMDVISLYHHGITNSVATLGTAINVKHIRKLLRYTNNIIFCFDGDRAGRQAAWKALTLSLPLLRDGIHLRFLFLPENEDPDSLVQRVGAATMRIQIGNATPIAEVFFAHLQEEIPLTSLASKAEFAKCANDLINTMPHGVFQQLLYQRLAKILDLKTEDLANLTETPKPSSQPIQRSLIATKPIQIHIDQLLPPALFATAILLQAPELITNLSYDPGLNSVNSPGIVIFLKILHLLKQQPSLAVGQILSEFDDLEEQSIIAQLAAKPLKIPETGYLEELNSAVTRLQQLSQQQRAQQLIEKARTSPLSNLEKQMLQKLLSEKAEKLE